MCRPTEERATLTLVGKRTLEQDMAAMAYIVRTPESSHQSVIAGSWKLKDVWQLSAASAVGSLNWPGPPQSSRKNMMLSLSPDQYPTRKRGLLKTDPSDVVYRLPRMAKCALRSAELASRVFCDHGFAPKTCKGSITLTIA